MAVNLTFSDFKESANVAVSKRQRVKHSLPQNVKNMLTNEETNEAEEQADTAGSSVNAPSTISTSAGASGAFGVVATEPFAACALCSVEMLLAAKNEYSDSELAHSILQPYVWSYIDDESPSWINEDNKSDIGAAAMSLISDGSSQKKLMSSKFGASEHAFNTFWSKYMSKYHHPLDMVGALQQGTPNQYARFVLTNLESRQKYLKNAFSQNGAVYDFMRRLTHFGNYMQAPSVAGKIMQNDVTPLRDLAYTLSNVRTVRENLSTISNTIVKHDLICKRVLEFYS